MDIEWIDVSSAAILLSCISSSFVLPVSAFTATYPRTS